MLSVCDTMTMTQYWHVFRPELLMSMNNMGQIGQCKVELQQLPVSCFGQNWSFHEKLKALHFSVANCAVNWVMHLTNQKTEKKTSTICCNACNRGAVSLTDNPPPQKTKQTTFWQHGKWRNSVIIISVFFIRIYSWGQASFRTQRRNRHWTRPAKPRVQGELPFLNHASRDMVLDLRR